LRIRPFCFFLFNSCRVSCRTTNLPKYTFHARRQIEKA
jgi:hypothetical protein